MCSSNSTWQQLGLQVTRNLQLPTCVPQAASTQQAKNATLTVTGAVSWRRPGLKYNKNEVFLDVVESVNLLVNSNGTLVLSEASDPASTPTAVCCVLRVSGSELLMFRPLPHVLVMYTQRSVHNGSPCK